jgi:hypothetical protein
MPPNQAQDAGAFLWMDHYWCMYYCHVTLVRLSKCSALSHSKATHHPLPFIAILFLALALAPGALLAWLRFPFCFLRACLVQLSMRKRNGQISKFSFNSKRKVPNRATALRFDLKSPFCLYGLLYLYKQPVPLACITRALKALLYVANLFFQSKYTMLLLRSSQTFKTLITA